MNRVVLSMRISELVTSRGGLGRTSHLPTPSCLGDSLSSHFRICRRKKTERKIKKKMEQKKRVGQSAFISSTSPPLYCSLHYLFCSFPYFCFESRACRSQLRCWFSSRERELHFPPALETLRLILEKRTYTMSDHHCLELSEKAVVFLLFEEFLTFVCKK